MVKFKKHDYLWFIGYLGTILITLFSLIFLSGNPRLLFIMLCFGIMSMLAIVTMFQLRK